MEGYTQRIGAWGEEEASLFLIQQGYEIAGRNISCRMGELDIIAWHEKPYNGKTLCFIEVKTRGYGLGSGARATNKEKVRHMQLAAKWYCKHGGICIEDTPIQFEQISVYGGPDRGVVSLQHFIIPIDKMGFV
ncbi:MAG: YraN family protein [Candidatus Magasanikbacteria bacterium]|nr:YraN family protein [Candidatus Magasanikbacteria bacterium]